MTENKSSMTFNNLLERDSEPQGGFRISEQQNLPEQRKELISSVSC